jgi:predicted phosphodiesterase|tara:strand:+ start:957 stop:1718 length:762 start_codon:yes stop_codon:yes gene_type:complete
MKIKERVVVFPDIHFPNHDEKAFRCALNVIRTLKPSAFLLLGDAIDGESVSHWQWRKKKRPPLEYQLPFIEKEIEEGNLGLDRIDKVLEEVGCEKKQFAQGNHEKWFDHFVEENPYLKHYGSRPAFRFDERGYEWHDYGEVFKVFGSKLYAYHGGHFMGIAHARTHALQMGCNIIYGHTHDSQKAVITHISGPHMAYSMGCLTDMSKDYLKGRPTNWTHNVGLVDIFTNNNFNLVVLDIVNGYTSYGGKIISA